MQRSSAAHKLIGSAVVAVLLPAALGAGVLTGCGGPDKSVSAQDRAALDDFAQAARTWKRKGTDPWYSAFKQGSGQLSAVAPQAEAQMAKSVRQMKAATAKIEEPRVRAALARLTASFSAKLATIEQLDSNLGSMAAIRSGLAGLERDGVTTKKAWDAWVAAAKQQWNANPLSGLKIG